MHPLISFEHSWIADRHRQLPSAAQLARQFRVLHARYPWVTDFATWNEANYCGQPTCHSAVLVAAYYRQMRRICPACNVLAAELLDVPGMVAWVRDLRRALGYEPGIWGLHNYIGANRLQSASTQALLSATHAQIWFTETGGVVARHNHSAHDFPESPAHAAVVTRFVFDRLVPLSTRIARVYLYQWNAATHRARAAPIPWDSALIGPRGAPRPGLLGARARAPHPHAAPRHTRRECAARGRRPRRRLSPRLSHRSSAAESAPCSALPCPAPPRARSQLARRAGGRGRRPGPAKIETCRRWVL